jgi:hypothetical protein
VGEKRKDVNRIHSTRRRASDGAPKEEKGGGLVQERVRRSRANKGVENRKAHSASGASVAQHCGHARAGHKWALVQTASAGHVVIVIRRA